MGYFNLYEHSEWMKWKKKMSITIKTKEEFVLCLCVENETCGVGFASCFQLCMDWGKDVKWKCASHQLSHYAANQLQHTPTLYVLFLNIQSANCKEAYCHANNFC